jgi:hypothetical protein
LKEMFLEGKVLQHLFVREILMESPPSGKITSEQTSAELCR